MVPGARVPADGVVVEGRSHVDESMVTGESVPVAKRPGDPVIGGTVNGGAPLIIKARRPPSSGLQASRHSYAGLVLSAILCAFRVI